MIARFVPFSVVRTNKEQMQGGIHARPDSTNGICISVYAADRWPDCLADLQLAEIAD